VATFPRLHAIVDVDVAATAGWSALDLATAYLDGGARLLQIRAKQLASDVFLDLCNAVVERAQTCDARVIVNDRADLARLSGASGVHVGQEDLSPSDVRRLLGADAIVGFSTHTLDQVRIACAEPVSYIAVGPVFGTQTKATGYIAVGLELVTAAVTECDRPIIAIGGITLENAPSVIGAGAAAVAVIGDLLKGGAPAVRVAAYCKALTERV